MKLKLTAREHEALTKLASLGSVYHLLRDEATTLIACGLVESTGDGMARITDDGRKYLRAFDIELAQQDLGKM
jgi:hypothetical protein